MCGYPPLVRTTAELETWRYTGSRRDVEMERRGEKFYDPLVQHLHE